MSEEADFAWLKGIHKELWPQRPHTPAREKLKHDDVIRIGRLIEKHKLITELFPSGMICGIGMAVYAHELFVGTGPEKLVCVLDDHLPGFEPLSWHEHLMGKEASKLPKKKPGDCDPYAWALFTRYANRPENTAWLKQYKLQPVKDKTHYDY